MTELPPLPPLPTIPAAPPAFSDLGLNENILEVLDEIGFESPMPIQSSVIPAVLEGADLIGLAETGSGKTAAFCLPILQRLSFGKGPFRALVMSPTREIALQTKRFLDDFAEKTGMLSVCLIGGVRMPPQIQGLQRKPEILVATPGRLLDHEERRNLTLSKIETLVLDEADHMLDLGFLPQIQRVMNLVPDDRQTLMFSATMPAPIERLAQRYMDSPARVDLAPRGAAGGIEHRVYLVDEDDKKPCVLSLLDSEPGRTLVFTRRRTDAEYLCRQLQSAGHRAARIHSDRSQSRRVEALEGFRSGQHRILVATDIAARGLDVAGVEHIVNFDLPDSAEDYIHRAGRTARGDAEGLTSSIATWLDKSIIKQIENALGHPLPRCEAPGVTAYKERATLQQRRKRSLRR